MTWCKAGTYTISSKPMPSSPPGRETATALTGFSFCPGALGFPSSLRALPAMPSNSASETRPTKLLFILWLLSKELLLIFLTQRLRAPTASEPLKLRPHPPAKLRSSLGGRPSGFRPTRARTHGQFMRADQRPAPESYSKFGSFSFFVTPTVYARPNQGIRPMRLRSYTVSKLGVD